MALSNGQSVTVQQCTRPYHQILPWLKLAKDTNRPRSDSVVRCCFRGELPYGTSWQDLVMVTISRISAKALHHSVLAFEGDTLQSFSTDTQLAMCRMAVENGALGAMCHSGDVAFHCKADLRRPSHISISQYGASQWRKRYAAQWIHAQELPLDARTVMPVICSPVSQRLLHPVHSVNYAIIGTAMFAPLEELRKLVTLCEGRSIAHGVAGIIVFQSRLLMEQAQNEGLIKRFELAGFQWCMRDELPLYFYQDLAFGFCAASFDMASDALYTEQTFLMSSTQVMLTALNGDL
ncbi:aconitase family protein [Vibrio tritonius]|uniref:aconitase family protein n=1 Tax=Vibrio tritonius TaxID=1435069 RepID=UPI0009E74A84|nr:aconitase family protein [Vibrio tritonius]